MHMHYGKLLGRWIAPLFFAIGLSSVVSLGVYADTSSSIDPTGKLRQVATREMNRLADSASAGILRLKDPSVLKDASLDAPFLMFASDSLFFAYDRAEADDLLRYTNWLQVCFPIRLGDRIIGTINLRQHDRRPYESSVFARGGEWEFVSLYAEDGTTGRLQQLARKANLENGQRVSILESPNAGTYFVVEDGTRVVGMIPVALWILEEMGMADVPEDSLWFQPPERFAPMIRSKIAESRRIIETDAPSPLRPLREPVRPIDE
jgi:hypothetical protein